MGPWWFTRKGVLGKQQTDRLALFVTLIECFQLLKCSVVLPCNFIVGFLLIYSHTNKVFRAFYTLRLLKKKCWVMLIHFFISRLNIHGRTALQQCWVILFLGNGQFRFTFSQSEDRGPNSRKEYIRFYDIPI